MTYEEIYDALEEGRAVRLPEWRGYWIKENGNVIALTKNGDKKNAWIETGGQMIQAIKNRTDWEIAEGLDFGWAICALKAGKLVTRAGWNGKGMFLFIRPEDDLDVETIVTKVKSLPHSLKGYFAQKTNPDKRAEEGSLDGSTLIRFTSYICMKAADGSIVNGWLASQTDMLAEDWQLFES